MKKCLRPGKPRLLGLGVRPEAAPKLKTADRPRSLELVALLDRSQGAGQEIQRAV